MATFISVNGKTNEISPKNGSDFSLEEMQEYVGGYVEVLDLDDDNIMIIDEEGKLKGKEINKLATLKYLDVYGFSDIIVGNAVICKSEEFK